MLDLDLDLEADLGIDTVKQAEMLAAVRETYNIPREENLKLRDFPTLARVIQFVFASAPTWPVLLRPRQLPWSAYSLPFSRVPSPESRVPDRRYPNPRISHWWSGPRGGRSH